MLYFVNQNGTTFSEKIRITTLVPYSWSRNRSFSLNRDSCSKCAVRKAIDIKYIFGILGKPTLKHRSGISDDVKRTYI